jgi:hypothetical protein
MPLALPVTRTTLSWNGLAMLLDIGELQEREFKEESGYG